MCAAGDVMQSYHLLACVTHFLIAHLPESAQKSVPAPSHAMFTGRARVGPPQKHLCCVWEPRVQRHHVPNVVFRHNLERCRGRGSSGMLSPSTARADASVEDDARTARRSRIAAGHDRHFDDTPHHTPHENCCSFFCTVMLAIACRLSNRRVSGLSSAICGPFLNWTTHQQQPKLMGLGAKV